MRYVFEGEIYTNERMINNEHSKKDDNIGYPWIGYASSASTSSDWLLKLLLEVSYFETFTACNMLFGFVIVCVRRMTFAGLPKVK